MQITIKGNRPVEILEELKFLGFLEEYSRLKTEDFMFEVKFKTQTPQFKVGMRVEAITDYLIKIPNKQLLTIKMVYRLNNEYKDRFYLIADNGKEISFNKQDISAYFKPYEKPIEGENYYMIVYSAEIRFETWENTDRENEHWNLGLAFREKEQAEFARERLSKLF